MRDRVSRVRDRLPESIKEPIVAKQDADAQAIMYIGLYSDVFTPRQMTTLAERQTVFGSAVGTASPRLRDERRFRVGVVFLDRLDEVPAVHVEGLVQGQFDHVAARPGGEVVRALANEDEATIVVAVRRRKAPGAAAALDGERNRDGVLADDVGEGRLDLLDDDGVHARGHARSIAHRKRENDQLVGAESWIWFDGRIPPF